MCPYSEIQPLAPKMQNPAEDTEWNSILRQKGILPPREDKEVTIDEDTVVQVSRQAGAVGDEGGGGGRRKARRNVLENHL